LNRVFPVFGNPILSIFLISGAVRFLVVIALVFKLKSTDSVKLSEDNFSAQGNVLYQSKRENPVTIRQVYPRFERTKFGLTSFSQPVAGTPVSVKNLDKKTVKPDFAPVGKKRTFKPSPEKTPTVDEKAVQTASPYRQTLIAASRQSSSEMLKGRPVSHTSSVMAVHRLARQPGLFTHI